MLAFCGFRQRLSAQMMMTTMIFQMMILVRMKNWNHPLMRWILLFSSWILSKVHTYSICSDCFWLVLYKWADNNSLLSLTTSGMCNPVLQASDPLRFQNLLTQTLDFHYQALTSGIAQHAEQRRVEIEKLQLEKASANASWFWWASSHYTTEFIQ